MNGRKDICRYLSYNINEFTVISLESVLENDPTLISKFKQKTKAEALPFLGKL